MALSGVQLLGNQPGCEAPLSFFAPNLAMGHGSALLASRQLKQVVDTLHSLAIEVLLQVGARPVR